MPDELVLATSLPDLPAEQVGALYEYRWQVELFFQFLRRVPWCQQPRSAKTPGARIQLHQALIAGFAMALAAAGTMTRRNRERLCLYFAGWSDVDEPEQESAPTNHPQPA